MVIPEYWVKFLDGHELRGKVFRIADESDLSGVGAELFIFDERQSVEEAVDFYPGLVVSRDGYVPVAGCLVGSGDPYFIKTDDGERGRLYRIYHDAVADDGYDVGEAVTVVLSSYEQLLQHVDS